MTHEFQSGTYRQTNLTSESEEYLAKREELRLAEIELMQHCERVAALRRALPLGPALQDYEFLEGPIALDEGDEPIHTVKLSELFTTAGRPLVIYHLMYGKKQVKPCPMCTMWIDGANGVTQQSLRTSILPLSRQRIRKRCAITHAHAAGVMYVCSARDRIHSSAISAAKTPAANRIPPSLSSRKMPAIPSGISILRIREWRQKSRSAASTCSRRCGTLWISRLRAGGIGTLPWPMEQTREHKSTGIGACGAGVTASRHARRSGIHAAGTQCAGRGAERL